MSSAQLVEIRDRFSEVLVGEAIQHSRARLTRPDETGAPEDSEMLRNGRWSAARGLGEDSGGDLRRGCDALEQLHPHGVGEPTHEMRHAFVVQPRGRRRRAPNSGRLDAVGETVVRRSCRCGHDHLRCLHSEHRCEFGWWQEPKCSPDELSVRAGRSARRRGTCWCSSRGCRCSWHARTPTGRRRQPARRHRASRRPTRSRARSSSP